MQRIILFCLFVVMPPLNAERLVDQDFLLKNRFINSDKAPYWYGIIFKQNGRYEYQAGGQTGQGSYHGRFEVSSNGVILFPDPNPYGGETSGYMFVTRRCSLEASQGRERLRCVADRVSQDPGELTPMEFSIEEDHREEDATSQRIRNAKNCEYTAQLVGSFVSGDCRKKLPQGWIFKQDSELMGDYYTAELWTSGNQYAILLKRSIGRETDGSLIWQVTDVAFLSKSAGDDDSKLHLAPAGLSQCHTPRSSDRLVGIFKWAPRSGKTEVRARTAWIVKADRLSPVLVHAVTCGFGSADNN
ncbi:MAG TPA: hypothetical protein PKV55_16125 [Nitrospira sp.]|nr:hypothetical protein [Nitrospira sp.]